MTTAGSMDGKPPAKKAGRNESNSICANYGKKGPRLYGCNNLTEARRNEIFKERCEANKKKKESWSGTQNVVVEGDKLPSANDDDGKQ